MGKSTKEARIVVDVGIRLNPRWPPKRYPFVNGRSFFWKMILTRLMDRRSTQNTSLRPTCMILMMMIVTFPEEILDLAESLKIDLKLDELFSKEGDDLGIEKAMPKVDGIEVTIPPKFVELVSPSLKELVKE